MKHILYLSLLLLFSGCDTGKGTQSDPKDNVNASKQVNDLPSMYVTMTDGTTMEMKEATGKTILVLFQPDCDHCQREAADIAKNLQRFSEYQMYFISSAPAPELLQFAVNYGLGEASNVHFGTTSVGQILNHFGSIPTPSLYIYSATGKLLSEFEGETPVEEILKTI